MAKHNILVIPSDHCGCGKYRSIDPHNMLNIKYPDLFECSIYDPMILQLNLRNLPEFLKKFDLIHIHKQLDGNAQLIQIFKFLGKKVIVDLDDHYQLHPTHPMYHAYTQGNCHKTILKHIQYADYVTTTTDFFKDILLRNNKNVAVLPNAINPNESQFNPVEIQSDKLRLGIICGSSHLYDIMLLNGLVTMLTPEELDKIQIVLCGFDTRGNKHILNPDGTKQTIPILPQESTWVRYEEILTNNYSTVSSAYKTLLEQFNPNEDCSKFSNEPYMRYWTKPVDEYATHYNNIDVLLVPLVENEFNLVKSQLKVIEAGFFKKGIIASNFGPYTIDLKSIVGKNGSIVEGNSILIDNHKGVKEWVKAIRLFLNNPELLKKTSESLYETVKNTYSLEKVTDMRKDLYLEILKV